MPKPPHLIFFVPDSYRGDVVGHLGNPGAHTPHLDALVGEGEAVSFRNAFCQNPVCVPSRCSFMSGWYPHVAGKRTMGHMMHPEMGQPTLLKLLKENGYHVWWGGKNDLVPGQDGPGAHCHEYFRPGEEDFKRWGVEPFELAPEETWRSEPGSDTFYSFMRGLIPDCPGVRVDVDYGTIRGALEFLEQWDKDQPLCLFIALSIPHPQYAIEQEFYDLIDSEKIPPRWGIPDPETPEPVLKNGIRERQNLTGWTEDRWKELRKVYYGMCARTDYFFGEIVQGLKRRGMYEDSAVFFFSDHGDYTGDYCLVEKAQNLFEDCLTRVPLVIKPPKGQPLCAGVRDDLVELVDFTATVLGYAGIVPDWSHFGRPLQPVIAGEAAHVREAVFCEGGRMEDELHCSEPPVGQVLDPHNKYWPRQMGQQRIPDHGKAAMCRTRRYKYVMRYYEDDQFFDLEKDPGELVNRIHDPAYGEEIARHKDLLLDWYMATCDAVPHQGDSRRMIWGGRRGL